MTLGHLRQAAKRQLLTFAGVAVVILVSIALMALLLAVGDWAVAAVHQGMIVSEPTFVSAGDRVAGSRFGIDLP
jgi:hypothetical protein